MEHQHGDGRVFKVRGVWEILDRLGDGSTLTKGNIVEYSMSSQMLRTFQVVGKADGLKYNPFDHKLWALRDSRRRMPRL